MVPRNAMQTAHPRPLRTPITFKAGTVRGSRSGAKASMSGESGTKAGMSGTSGGNGTSGGSRAKGGVEEKAPTVIGKKCLFLFPFQGYNAGLHTYINIF